MTQILPSEIAKRHCLALMQELDASDLGKALRQKGHGRMFGILVCTDGTIYKAFSGELEGSYTADGFAPPVFDVRAMNVLLERYDTLIKNAEGSTREISQKAWSEVKDQYIFTCHDGSKAVLSDIFSNAPAGTGDCCAPRLLSYAYLNKKRPLSLCEFFYGDGSHPHKSFHGPCDARCKPILPTIVGLDILYQDSDIVVVNKPSGMLSIEGRGPDKQDCVASRVRSLFDGCIQQPCIHRLDQATSGLLVLGLTKKAHDTLCLDFEQHRVHKEYEALVDGLILEAKGTIELPIRLDTDNRPHQIVDFEQGKKAVTDWTRLKIENRFGKKCTRLKLEPRSGRTHQLRVHCASGLGCPIHGDALYGTAPNEKYPRLMLQAKVLEFEHPITKVPMRFELEPEF